MQKPANGCFRSQDCRSRAGCVVICKENIACIPRKIYIFTHIKTTTRYNGFWNICFQRRTSRTTSWTNLSSEGSFRLLFVEPLARRSALQESYSSKRKLWLCSRNVFFMPIKYLNRKFGTALLNFDLNMFNMHGRIYLCIQEWSLWAESLVQACSTWDWRQGTRWRW